MYIQKSKQMPGKVSGITSFLVLLTLIISNPTRTDAQTNSEFQFTEPRYNASIYEGLFGNVSVTPSTKMGIYLWDTSMAVNYKVKKVNPRSNFDFEAEERLVGNFCFLHVRTVTQYSVLNRERNDAFLLQIVATGRRRGQKFSATTEVAISILDVNDVGPIFDKNSYSAVVSEDSALHTSVTKVYATDADIGRNGEIYYSFIETSHPFAIHPTSGDVTVIGKLNYDDKNLYELQIIASDRGLTSTGISGRSTDLTIEIQQVNAHSPVIRVQKIDSMSNTQVGSLYAVIYVTDDDHGSNGDIQSVQIVSGNPGGYFRLVDNSNDREPYKIEVAKPIDDVARANGFNLTIRASDKGNPAKSSYLSILVDFMYEKRGNVQFSKQSYQAYIDECVPILTQVFQAFIGNNSVQNRERIIYTIEEGNNYNWFSIIEDTGMIYVKNELDAELETSVDLKILAQGRIGQKASDHAIVHIKIGDCNDNAPRFVDSEPALTINENLAVGTSIGRVTAEDLDSGDFQYLSYSIANTEPVPFDIDHFTGEIHLTKELDFETMRRLYELKIRASDWGTPERQESETKIRILLQDVNDNIPGFEKVDCIGHLSKEAAVGVNVVSISAIDYDAGDIIRYRIVSGNEDNCFKMLSASGVIQTNCDLRSSAQNFRSLVVEATDDLHSSLPTNVNITLVNNKGSSALANREANVVCTSTEIAKAYQQLREESAANNDDIYPSEERDSQSPFLANNHPPRFAQNLADYITVPENVPTEEPIFTFKASDSDHGYNGMLRYVITSGNSDGKFNVSTYSGELYVVTPLDREYRDTYTLHVTVYDTVFDPTETSKYDEHALTINISDVNDNAPVFKKPSYSATIPENEVVGKSILHLTATDRDSFANSQVTYSFVSHSEHFEIDPQSGIMHLSKSLDRELQSTHELTIKAQDGGTPPLSSVAIVNINVDDVNDNEPKFMPASYHVHIREDLPIGAVIVSLTAFDPDLKGGGAVRYAIIDGDDGNFEIDHQTGIIRLMQPLDYEQKQMYNMTARAKDKGEPMLSSRCPVIIEVVDVDENLHKPLFDDYVYTADITENQPRGTQVLQLSARDLDTENALATPRDYELLYEIVDGDGIGKFSVDNTGTIRTNAVLDRESKWQYWITVVVSDRGAVPQSSWAEVYIKVLDVNDNIPRTSLPEYYWSVRENSPEGAVVGQLEATDLDEDNVLTYEITSGNPQGFFSIDSSRGSIRTTTRKLDREKIEEHILEVTIRDNGSPSLSSTTRVVVTVEDENDNAPEFLEKYYSVELPEMSNLQNTQIPLYRVIAEDLDKGENARITYSISSGKSGDRFVIHRITGVIETQKPFEQGMSFELIVEARDNGDDYLVGTARVKFTVVSVPAQSPHAPRFDSIGYSEEVFENEKIGSFITSRIANDDDGDTIWYSLFNGNNDSMFSIGKTSGGVILAQTLDRERIPEYNLTIQASDGVHYTYSWLHIRVLDVNDNRPQFDQTNYTVSVPESIESGTNLLTLTATDADENKKLYYTLDSVADEASKNKFNIDTETDKDGRWTGVLSTTDSLNRESVAQHELTIMVRDVGNSPLRSLARVSVLVSDYNDHSPEFLQESLSTSVHETVAMGTSVVKVMAIDRDHGRNAHLSYAIVSGNIGNTFEINSFLGVISVQKPLNRSKHAQYTLTVQVKDEGLPSLSNTTLVHINVTIADNAPPKFGASEYTAEIEENQPELTLIKAVTATSQSSVTYDITSGNEDQSFLINPSSGVIMTNERFDYEKRQFYNLTIRAVNVVNVHAEAHVVVHILDVNDNEPVFSEPNYTGSISEEASPGSVVLSNSSTTPLVIRATDSDSDMNAWLTYSIVDPQANRLFEIDPNTGAIKIRTSLDHEESDTYRFTVQVEDSGKSRLSAKLPAEVVIHVTDVNDSPPRFVQSTYEVTLLLPTYENVVVAEPKALDADSPINGQLVYSITSGNIDDSFQIDPESGILFMQREGSNLRDRYDLRVKVTDGQFQDNCQVIVHVDLTRDSGLVFTEEEYSAEVTENSTETEFVVVVQTRGHELNEHISFSILNPSTMFTIGTTSGLIQTTGIAFDRERQELYQLIVEVSDSREPPRLAHARVKVSVSDINDHVPMFIKQPYYTVVSLDARDRSFVRKVEAIDKDLGINGQVNYSIVSGNTKRHFRIVDNTGEIFLRRAFEPQDENHQFMLIIKATDNGYEPLSSRVEVPVTVKNRHTPIFAEQFYSIEIPENIELDSAVLNIEAESPTGKKIIYSISDGNVYGEFDIHFSLDMDILGPCSITVVDRLDYETMQQYELTVRATDTMTGSYAQIKVQVNLQDVNDHAPEFIQQHYYGQISEAAAVGTSVITVTAEDDDSGINARLYYDIEPLDVNADQGLSDGSQYFHIEPDTGIVLIKQKLDRELMSVLSFVVVATDGGNPTLSGSVVVQINVTDMNDNAPIFEKSTYDVFLTDLAKRGQFVTIVSASDADSSENNMRFSIVGGNERQAFVINESSGIISLSGLRAPDLLPEYILNASVTDGVFTSFARVKVTVQNSNSHVPIFADSIHDVDVSENMPRNYHVKTLSATDDDQGLYGHVTYSVDSKELSDVFKIDSETGELTTASVLDREECAQYMVPIAATDGGGRIGYTTVRVNVADQGDNKPHFMLNNYRTNVFSNAPVDTIVIKVAAEDRDLAMNSNLDYSLVSGNGFSVSEWFEIERQDGAIKVKKDLSQKEGETFEFFVRAKDKGSPPRQNDAPVEIYVMPPDAQPPRFPKDSYNYFVSENRDIGSIIAKIEATSESRVKYRIVSGFMPHTNKPPRFEIDDEGQIAIIEKIDREEVEKYELTIMASVDSVPPLVAYAHVTVPIIDVNDNPPKFEADPYTVMVAENAEIGSRVVQIIAHDSDSGPNADIGYNFAPEDASMSSVFYLDPESGWISTLVELDREMRYEYEFSVEARDNGRIRLSDVTRVHIEVLDHNDNPPVFSVDLYQGQVAEDALPGTVVLSVRTSDLDYLDINARVAYSIISGDSSGSFAIRDTGAIYVNKALDRESRAQYELGVLATDGAFVSEASVHVRVLDVNDNAPQCEQPRYRKTISERFPVGSFVIQVSAWDADEPGTQNSTLTYDLEDTFDTFDIRTESGIITNVREFDRETIPEYTLSVHVTDGGGLQCSMRVLVTIADTNDNSPTFEESPLPEIRLREDAPVNTTLTRVTATDIDEGISRQVKYALSKESDEFFKIDEISGILSLRKAVDRERQDMHNITIYAYDQGTPRMNAVTYQLVKVTDVNDNPPEFARVTYNQVVSEAMPVDSPAIQVFATSRDIGKNAEIEYRIVDGNNGGHFYIDPQSGMVTLVKSLDYEIAREYILTIEARDHGDPPLSNTAMLRVNVTDYNDNAPHFSQEVYRATKQENLAPGTVVATVLATDKDSGQNAQLTYFIVGGNIDQHFAIPQNNGDVVINKALDREQVDSYTLEIHAVDQGTPQLTGVSRVHITILDVNDCPPQFDSLNYTTNVQEDRDIGHRVLQLTLTDNDLDPNGAPFSYDIVAGNEENKFRVTREGMITTTATFERDIKDTYYLTVQAVDNGDPPLHSEAEVTIHIIEESAFLPTVTQLSVTVTTGGEKFCDAMIGQIQANDQDPYDILTFDIISRNRDYFSVHSQDGTINVVECIDAGDYQLNVSVTDGKFTIYGNVNVRVVAIYEEMANEALVIRLGNMSPEEFIQDHRQPFIEYLKNSLEVEANQIHILSIQPSSDSIREPPQTRKKRAANNANLDVLIAIGDENDVWRRNRLFRTLNQITSNIEEDLDVNLIGIIHDVCPPNACANKGNCKTVVYLSRGGSDGKGALPILTEDESYVSAQHELGYICRCKPGYSGDRCEETVDVCSPDPCPAPRKCESDGLRYVCQCPPGKTGDNCEYEDCGADGCPDEQPISFNGQSYLLWRVTLAMERLLHLSLSIKTVENNARIMHADGGLDYSFLELDNGYVQYRFDCGSGEGLAKSNSIRVNDGLWHHILVERNNRQVKLTIDDRFEAKGTAPGSNAVLNLDSNYLYFGGEVATSDNIQRGFIGCMKGISLDHIELPLSGSNSVGVLQNKRDVQFHCRGIFIDGICNGDSCENGGTCRVEPNGHMCLCPNGYSGAMCEIHNDPCISDPCRHGGTCSKSGNGYVCTCPKNFKGPICEGTTYCESNPCLHGGQCVERSYGASCNCTNKADGPHCENLIMSSITGGSLPFGLSVQEVVGILIALVAILLIVIVLVCILSYRRRRSKRQYHQAQTTDNHHHFYSQDDLKARGKIGSVEDNNLNFEPSPKHKHDPPPPPVPARPASYTPSAEGTISSLANGYGGGSGLDNARNYGSAADDLNNMSTIQEPIQIPEFMTNVDVDKPLLDKSPQPPPRKVGSSHKRGWDPNIDFPDVHKKQHKTMPSDHQSSESIQLLQRDHNGDSVASLPITEPDDLSQDYHWDTSDWHPTNHVPSRDMNRLPSNSVHTTPAKGRGNSVKRTDSFRPDSFTIDPDADYSYTDFADEDEIIDSEYVGDSEFTENECGSDTGDDLDDDHFEAMDYQDMLQNGLDKYLPHYSDIEPSQTGDSNWGSRDDALNDQFDSIGNLADDETMNYGFSLPRPRIKGLRHKSAATTAAGNKGNKRFSGDFGQEYERTTGAIPMDDFSVAGFTSMSSIGNVCEIEDSEANLSDSDSENRSNESMRLVKSNTNLHTVV